MPIVTIQVTREGTKPGADSVTAEEKAAPVSYTHLTLPTKRIV